MTDYDYIIFSDGFYFQDISIIIFILFFLLFGYIRSWLRLSTATVVM